MTKFVVAGVVRDICSSIDADLERLMKTLNPLGEVLFILIESNSKDDSVRKLADIASSNPAFKYITLGESSNEKIRTERISDARNEYLDFISKSPAYANADYLIVCDFNNLNSKINTTAVEHSLSLKDWDVCTANQSTRYYDIWALRHPLWSPNDCWQQLEFYRQNGLRPDLALNAAVQSRMLHIDKNGPAIKVDSAFGGFAIYKMNIIGNARYSGVDSNGKAICEHVPFHKTLKENGFNIIINPSLINAGWVDHTNETRVLWKLLRTLKYPIKWVKKKISS
jgi:hypothetical protein